MTLMINGDISWQIRASFKQLNIWRILSKSCNGWLLKFSLGVGFERVFIFSVTLDTRKNERQMSVGTTET
jgi:hypothetical protein